MQLKAFRVQKFRNIEDSGEVELLDPLTCVVGKNQAGKSALLRGLHKFNPHSLSPYDMRHEWPRGQRTKRNENQTVCEVRFTLSAEELKQFSEIAGQELSGEEVVVTRNYGGDFEVQFPEDSTLFPGAVQSNLIDATCQNFPTPTESVSEKFLKTATKCILEAKQLHKGWPLRGTKTASHPARSDATEKTHPRGYRARGYRAPADKRKPVHFGLQGEAG